MPNLWIIFLTGLLAGGITCTAVQGGLLAALLVHEGEKVKANRRIRMISIIVAFVGAKLVSHTTLGFLLGFMGEKMQFSVQFTAVMLGVASLFMIGMAVNMLGIHPAFRRLMVTSPRVFRLLMWKHSKRTDMLAPVIVGALTIFIPCGTTQAMMAQAIASGSPVAGALILFSFILGTIPLFILLGLAITTLSQAYKKIFERIAALVIIGMAVWNLYNVSVIFNLPGTLSTLFIDSGNQRIDSRNQILTTKAPVITMRQTKYEIDNPYIMGGEEIVLTVVNKDGYGCIQYFTIPKLGIQKAIPPGEKAEIIFVAPKERGELVFACSMGMYRGHFIVQ